MELTKEELECVAAEAYRDPVYFCQFFLGHWFRKPLGWFARGIMSVLTQKTDFLLKYGQLDKIVRHFVYGSDPDNPNSSGVPIFTVRYENGLPVAIDLNLAPNTLVLCFRGSGKTTLANAAVLYWILYGECKFPVYLSETQTHAERQLQNVKAELEANSRIIAVFGQLRPDQRQGKIWTQDIIQTTTGVSVAARGRGSQVRGTLVDARRPDRLLFDDIEDRESVKTAEQLEKTKSWAYGDAFPALADEDEGAMMLMLATLLSGEALAAQIKRDPDWNVIDLEAVDKDGDMLFPEKLSRQRYERLKLRYAAQGQLSTFYLEYHNKVRAEEQQKFRREHFIYDPADWSQMHRAICIDPAISEKPGADFCAFAVVGISQKGMIHILHADGKRGMTPREQVDEYFRLRAIFRPHKSGVESVAYQKALVHLLREEMFRRKDYFEITAIGHHSQSKDRRILGILQPRYAAGYVRHARPFPLLESQLLDFPNGKRDVPDAVAMAVALLDPYAAQAADPESDLGEDEYPPLSEVLEGDFAQCP